MVYIDLLMRSLHLLI